MLLPLDLPPWLRVSGPILLVTVVSALCLLVLRSILLRALQGFTSKTNTKVDDFVVRVLRSPSLLWCFSIAIYLGLATEPVPDLVQAWASRILSVLLIVSMTLVFSSLASEALHASLRRRHAVATVTTIGDVVVRGTIMVLGLLVLLNYLGIQITPMLTALGVGGLAVALALQDTLGNLFAGIHILLERPFAVGQWIEVEDQEGRVIDIGWRTTRIQTLADHMVVIPNSKIANSTIRNLYLPTNSVRVVIDVGVSYDADPEQVIRVLVQELELLDQESEYFEKNTQPEAWVASFGDSAVNYQVRMRICHAEQARQARDLMFRRVFRRLKQEQMEIPFAQRVIHIRKEPT